MNGSTEGYYNKRMFGNQWTDFIFYCKDRARPIAGFSERPRALFLYNYNGSIIRFRFRWKMIIVHSFDC